MRPTTCVVAAEEPEIAANIEQPRMLTCSSRPGSNPAHGANPVNSERDSWVRNSSSPMTMKSGSAKSSCVVRMFQAYCERSLSSGISLKTASINAPVMPSVRPIQTPPASSANRIANMARVIVSMASSLHAGGGFEVWVFQRQPEGA